MFEPTGPHHRSFETALAGKFPLAKVNPLQARRVTEGEPLGAIGSRTMANGTCAKTDAVDARVLARRGAAPALELEPDRPISEASLNLKDLQVARTGLVKERTRLRNGGQTQDNAVLKRRTRPRLALVERQIKELNPFTVLGANSDPDVPGLGFHFDMIEGKPLPHITGRAGVLEAHTPPHFASMRAAVDAVVTRKFGPRGPFNPGTDGPYRDNAGIRGAAAPMGEESVGCVALMAEYLYAEFGRYPATVPAIHTLMYLQAHQLDTGFYDTHFSPGAHLETHANHERNWA